MEKFRCYCYRSGPGGYVAAIRCAQLGMKTALIENIPVWVAQAASMWVAFHPKPCVDSTEHFHKATHDFEEHGIEVKSVKANLPKMIERKRRGVVKQTVAGIDYLMKKNKITVLTGHGSFINKTTIEITKADGSKEQIESAKTIIATGSKPASLPGIEIDKKRIITSTEALELQEIPKHLIIIGGGVIGLELGSVYARLGAKVSVVEFMDSIIATMDRGLGKELQRLLKKDLGFDFYMKHKVTGVTSKGKEVTVSADNDKGEKIELKGDYCLVAVGRKPYTENLGLDKAGVKVDNRGRIETDEHLRTNVDNIYAIGDVIKGAMLAHKAEEEGAFVAEAMVGQKPHINYNLIPGVVYTWPRLHRLVLLKSN